MLSSPASPPVLTMLTNFRKRFFDPCRSHPTQEQSFLSLPEAQADALDNEYPGQTNNLVAPQHGTITMPETGHNPDCNCSGIVDVVESICTTAQPHTRSHAHFSMPSFRSVMEVLYPPSYLGIPSPFPDPPSYSRSDCFTCPRENDQLISSTATSTERPLSQSYLDPLAQDPAVTGVPSPFQRISPNGVLLVEPNPRILDFEGAGDVPEEPLPAYSPLDQRRPRFPTASDILGPYPSMSVLRRCTR